jgi:hypothetical protein
MQPTAQNWILATNRSEAVRKAADTVEFKTCRSIVRGCAQAADTISDFSCRRPFRDRARPLSGDSRNVIMISR